MAQLNDIQLKIIVKGIGIDNLDKLQASLTKTATAVQNGANTTKAASSKWSDFGHALGNLERNFDAIFRAASHLQSLGHDLTSMGQAGTKMLAGATQAWGDYEFELNRAAGALGIFDTMSPIYERLNEGASKLAVNAKLFPAEEVAHGIYLWGSATGQTVKNQEDLDSVMTNILPLMKLSAMTNTDLEASMKGVYQITQQYELGMGAVKDVTEAVFQTAQKTTLEVPDVIESFKYLGASAHSLNVPFEDIVQLFGRLGDLGIRGSTAGRGVAQMFTKLVDPTQQGAKALDTAFKNTESLGKSFNDLVFPNGEFVGLAKYVDMLSAATENMTTAERGHLIATISTQNEQRVLLPLINAQIKARKEHRNILLEDKVALDESNSSFEGAWNILSRSWKGTLGGIGQAFQGVVREIGRQVAIFLTPFLEALTKIVSGIDMWMKTHPSMVKWLTTAIAIGSAMLLIAGAMFTGVGVLLAFGAGITFVVHALAEFLGHILGVGKGVTVLGEAATAGQKALYTLGQTLTKIAGPLLIVVTAIVTNAGGIRDALGNLISSIVAFVNALDIDWSAVLRPFQILGEIVQGVLTGAFSVLAGILNTVSGWLNDIAGNKGAATTLGGVVTALLTMVSMTASVFLLINAIKTIYSTFMLMKAIPGILKLITAAQWLWNIAVAANPIVAIAAAIIGAITLLYLAWKNNWFGMRDIISKVFNFFAKIAGDIVSTFIGVAKNVNGVAAAIPGPWQEGAKKTQIELEKMQASVDSWGEGIETSVPTHAKKAIDGMVSAFDRGSAEMNVSPKAAQNIIDPIKGTIVGGMNETKSKVHQIAATIPATISDAIYGAKDDFSQAKQLIKDTLEGSVSDSRSKLRSQAMLAGKDIETGLTSRSSETKDIFLRQIVEPQLDSLQALTGKTYRTAKDIPEKFRAGIVANLNRAVSAVRDLRDKVAPGMDLVRFAKKQGYDNVAAWIQGQRQQRTKAKENAEETKRRVLAASNLDKMADVGRHGAVRYAEGLAGGEKMAKNSADILTAAVKARISGFPGDMAIWGTNAAVAFAEALSAQAGTLARESAKFLAGGRTILQFASPPKAGPWKKIDKWGANAGHAFSDGLIKSKKALKRAAQDYLRTASREFGEMGEASTNFSATHDVTRRVKLEITSPDGSVNKRKIDEIREIFSSAELVESIEHMASIA